MAVANRTAISRALDFSRLSSSFVRTFSSSSPSTSSSNPNASPTSSQTKRRKKKKNLFEVVQFLPNWGVGYHVAKSHWDEISYQITKINLYKSGTHGKAWGIAHKNGTPIVEAPKKISGVHKRCWKYIASLPHSGESKTSAEVQTS
ncbi:uncharacterized protein LOC101207989 [Cucumis sativus]|uniref:Mitochondrial 28S ribosomal protein S34 n=1 Tax=Cucumis sativus TaxID=3659 RepID=A0A0A0KH76_CUCSA|nr:uncharacterized protein LOC101207989 [Cucumis sativus]KGN47116.1 hypothetical protein Csa_020646 [Cucumis sativus]